MSNSWTRPIEPRRRGLSPGGIGEPQRRSTLQETREIAVCSGWRKKLIAEAVEVAWSPLLAQSACQGHPQSNRVVAGVGCLRALSASRGGVQ